MLLEFRAETKWIKNKNFCTRNTNHHNKLRCHRGSLRLSLDTIEKEVLRQDSEKGKKFGHVIKVENSYISETCFAYSKDAYVKNVEQPQSFRKVQKCYGADNAFMTTVDDYISSACRNAHRASKTSPSPIACFHLAVRWSFESL